MFCNSFFVVVTGEAVGIVVVVGAGEVVGTVVVVRAGEAVGIATACGFATCDSELLC